MNVRNTVNKFRWTLGRLLIKPIDYSKLIFNSSNEEKLAVMDRDEFDKEITNELRSNIENKAKLPTVSAIFRVRNGQEYIECAILSIASFVTEIIVVDNESTDRTVEIVKELKLRLENIVHIKLFNYSKKLEIAGEGYKERVLQNPEGSLSRFYDYCFSQGQCDYLMKCDAHAIFTRKGINLLTEALKSEPDIISFRGSEIYGKQLSMETSLFKRNQTFRFVDKERWEQLEFSSRDALQLKEPVYLHVKRLSFIKNVHTNDLSPARAKYNL